jgi:hypothetical protein
MRRIACSALGVILLTLACRPAFGDDRLFIRPWVELEPIVRIEPEYPIPLEKAGQWVLEEARTLLSGMVFGWTFSWTPSDASRKVADRFDLVPVAEIPWGSDRLAVRQTQVEEARLFAQVSYTMSPGEQLRRESWAGAVVDAATGTGEAPTMKGRDAKLEALGNAIKDAVRNHLRTRIFNKPREIRGEVVLWDDPQVWVTSGSYHAVARIRLRVVEVIPYRIF